MEIVGSVMNYDWGELGSDSTVAELSFANSSEKPIERCTPYAELWMGDHPNGPSKVKATGNDLSTVVKDKLPYLFKVLSIKKPLSIQVHPNKMQALRLHNVFPHIYKDTNHKPELAIALTPFLALCGFRPMAEIYNYCSKMPPLRDLIGEDNVEMLKDSTADSLRICYSKLMKAEKEDVEKCIDDLFNNHVNVFRHMRDIYRKLNSDFPGDVGVLSLFFLNFLRLKPGEAIYLPANEIHAYISGDCVECMACSDNVIRAGLTPKFKDVDELIGCLSYICATPETKLFLPTRIDDYVRLFIPPVKDFAVAQIVLPKPMEEYTMQVKPLSSILLVLQGKCILQTTSTYDVHLKRGSIIYIPPEAAPSIKFILQDDGENKECFVAYMAMANEFIEEDKCTASSV